MSSPFLPCMLSLGKFDFDSVYLRPHTTLNFAIPRCMVGDALSVVIQGENSQRILLISNHRQWTSPTSATYENQALKL